MSDTNVVIEQFPVTIDDVVSPLQGSLNGNEAAHTVLAFRENLLNLGYSNERAQQLAEVAGNAEGLDAFWVIECIAMSKLEQQSKVDTLKRVAEVIDESFIGLMPGVSGRRLINQRLKIKEEYHFGRSLYGEHSGSGKAYQQTWSLRMDCLRQIPRMSKQRKLEKRMDFYSKLLRRAWEQIAREPLEDSVGRLIYPVRS